MKGAKSAIHAAVDETRVSRNAQFNLNWAGQALSAFGNAFGMLAFPLLVLDLTGSLFHMGWVSGVYGASRLVAGVLVGLLVDAVDRRRLMLLCDVGRAVTYGAVPVVWLVEPQLWLLYLCSALGTSLGLTFQVARVSMVHQLVSRSQLVDANGRLETSNSLSYFVGPLVAGVVAAAFGPANAIAINAGG